MVVAALSRNWARISWARGKVLGSRIISTRKFIKQRKYLGRSWPQRAAWSLSSADEDETTTSISLNVGGSCFHGNAKHVR